LIETQRGADVTARLVAEKEASISFPVTGMTCAVQQADYVRTSQAPVKAQSIASPAV
jgi:hypothetical protein